MHSLVGLWSGLLCVRMYTLNVLGVMFAHFSAKVLKSLIEKLERTED